MLEVAIFIYTLYFLVSFYVSFMQIDYIKKARDKEAIFLTPAKYFVAANYAIKKERISLLSHFIFFIVFFMWISFGLSSLENFLSNYTGLVKTILFVNIFFLINFIITLPIEIYTTFKLDKEFGFSKTTIKLFITDTIKTIILFLIFGNIIISILYYLINNFSSWWILAFVVLFSAIILLNILYPIIRDKMFDKFSEVNGDLRDSIEELLKKVGFKSSGIFSVDASKRDSRLNAYFGGLGKTKRVVLFDTLIEKLSKDEILAVLGHELGHFKNKDIIKNIAIMGVVLFIFCFIFGNLDDSLFLSLHINKEPYSIIVLFLMFSSALSFFLMPLISYISRKNEYNADKFGANLTSNMTLVRALLKLVNENKSFPLSHPIYIFFYYSHPPLVDRLKALGYTENIDLDDLTKQKCEI